MSSLTGDGNAQADLSTLEERYELVREIGRGATALVYLARDRATGTLVAIKAMRGEFAQDPEVAGRFEREARTAAALDHPNIARIFAVARLEGRALAIVMQYVPGGTLREALRDRGALPFEETERVLRDVAAALAYAHESGVVHRDVKPENIFLEEGTGRALLADFGIARSLDSDHSLTMAGSAIGTPTYMSPEQIDGHTVDGRSDLYSLGLVGWEMLAGERPWQGESLYNVIYKQKHQRLPRLDELRPGIPAPLLYAIEGALLKRREDRWAGAAEFLTRLSEENPGPRPA
ncbi:MAG: Serine/threonine protein kinase, partial [uncultured Gemmatimonadaceae bacterium]